jgi:tetratricopeptide (TPR) repeat protein
LSKQKIKTISKAPHKQVGSLPSSDTNKRKTFLIQLAVIVVLGFVLYGNTIGNEYALDDSLVIVKNTLTTQGIKAIPKILSTDAFYGFFGDNYKFVAGGRYRPLSNVTFAIEYSAFGGLKPHISHFINILLFCLLGIVLFLVLSMMFKQSRGEHLISLPFLATLLFMVHPIHTEAVANIKGRDEIMGLLGSLLTLYFALSFVLFDKKRYIFGIIICFIFGLLSKENAITFVAIVPLAIYFFTDAKKEKYIPVMGIMLVISVLFIFFRQKFTENSFIEQSKEVLNNPYVLATMGEKYATITNTLGRYLLLLVFPYPLSHDYYFSQIPIINWSSISAIIPLLINAGLIVYAIKGFKTKDPIAFCILFYFASLSIVSNMVVNVGTTMSERFLFMPSVGFCIVVAILLSKLNLYISKSAVFRLSSPVLIPFFLVLILFSVKTIARNPVWKDDLTLFGTDVHTSTNSAKLNNAYGGELVTKSEFVKDAEEKKRMLTEAVRVLSHAVELYPNYLNAWLLLGNAHYGLSNDVKEAEPYYQNALKINPNYFEGNFNLGLILNGKGLNQEAKYYLTKATQTKPKNPEPWYYLGKAYYDTNVPDSAIYALTQELNLRPNDDKAYHLLGLTYGRLKNDIAQSIVYFQKAIQINPKEEYYYEDMGVAFGMKGDFKNAISTFENILKLNPQSAKAFQNLGISYMQMGDKEKANEYFAKIKR